VHYLLSIRKVDPVDRGFKEGSDGMILGSIKSTAVYLNCVVWKI